ncbi:6-phosphogluconolactonase [Arenibacter nanhaiticus]|uniref:6-phosphogluconolactonase n=1 Tax=Arenibacter nanhaiticus TaxID=558155 RepID=A0A1M6ED26_9FLAO|nr:6-phosphogluconolactonase [Arenibacter nanhaiticus]SHI83386.1 6-phosphogluconolactonase [Arenibacter nanhaiticus]
MEIKIFASKKEVAKNFSDFLEELIESNGSAHIALSGGSTPKEVFDFMAANYKGVNWANAHFYWGDERCVPPTDAESNYRMTVDHLLSKIDIPQENIHRVFGEDQPAEEAQRYAKLLGEKLPMVNNTPQFDLVILGMGDDGHTASIFPHEIELWNAEDFCEVAVHPDSGQRRITLTGKVINNAKTVAFLVTGKGKAEKVTKIINEEPGSHVYPASLVAPATDNLIWFLDEEAAAGII